MEIKAFPFQTPDWSDIEAETHPGTTGTATRKIFQMGDTRIRMVEYSANYFADHWCHKGHIIYCISGEMVTELEDGRQFTLSQGMTYHVGDNSEAHRSRSANGCKLFVVD
ncbi:MAG: DHCW motif cupin fold protein [Chitinophagaceae bacterium]|nr:DHCW motif cupin fold protein [Chitinophagaceae bacterium]MBK7123850.1 DHCW motif cupin fold protein [Chitinophagaceae bacterium]MBK9533474.1 DHCW motif cupin fold protein [Chitinophagaceae bacterium]HQW93993.1 DHCW motif cupin fold protein [Ferruginibacter sp.]